MSEPESDPAAAWRSVVDLDEDSHEADVWMDHGDDEVNLLEPDASTLSLEDANGGQPAPGDLLKRGRSASQEGQDSAVSDTAVTNTRPMKKTKAGAASQEAEEERLASKESNVGVEGDEDEGEGAEDEEVTSEEDDSDVGETSEWVVNTYDRCVKNAITLPSEYVDVWDTKHVKLPCSPKYTYRLPTDPKTTKKSRWELICTQLDQPIVTVSQLETVVLSYSADVWNFNGLREWLRYSLACAEREYFFTQLLPYIIHLAFRLPHLVSAPIPLLVVDAPAVVQLSQLQVASLMAHVFLCTLPRQGPKRTSRRRRGMRSLYSHVSMQRLFSLNHGDLPENQGAKLWCVCHYFDRIREAELGLPIGFYGAGVTGDGTAASNAEESGGGSAGNVSKKEEQQPQQQQQQQHRNDVPKTVWGTVRLERRVIRVPDCPNWATSDRALGDTAITLHSKGLIEDDGDEALHVDFANKRIGGGVLGHGCIQEEIRFIIAPELIISLLVCAQLGPLEAVWIDGAERYCKYEGYASSFRFTGDFRQQRSPDGAIESHVTVMDAQHFGMMSSARLQQWRMYHIDRELNKAYVAWDHRQPKRRIATGNWGCGAFGGLHDLKAIIQIMVAAQVGVSLSYYTFGEPGLTTLIQQCHEAFTKSGTTVGQLYTLLQRASAVAFGKRSKLAPDTTTEATVKTPPLVEREMDERGEERGEAQVEAISGNGAGDEVKEEADTEESDRKLTRGTVASSTAHPDVSATDTGASMTTSTTGNGTSTVDVEAGNEAVNVEDKKDTNGQCGASDDVDEDSETEVDSSEDWSEGQCEERTPCLMTDTTNGVSFAFQGEERILVSL